MDKRIELLITDFDGTLVDTFEANYKAYKHAFCCVGRVLTEVDYRNCFGLRFERFMETMHIHDFEIASKIKEEKGRCYPEFFNCLKVNNALLQFIRAFRASGGKTAIASTARKKNLINALTYIGASEDFDLILTGEDVDKGKPSPEIYMTVLKRLNIIADNALVFEDSEVGFQSAEAAGIRYVKIDSFFYGD